MCLAPRSLLTRQKIEMRGNKRTQQESLLPRSFHVERTGTVMWVVVVTVQERRSCVQERRVSHRGFPVSLVH